MVEVVKDKKSSKIFDLVADTPRQDVIDRITEWLEAAKAGDLTGIAGMAYIKSSGPEWIVCGTAVEDYTKTLGVIEVMKHDILHHVGLSLESTEIDTDPSG